MKEFKNITSNPDFIASIQECEKQISPILQKYLTNFPDYTDHSIDHSKTVLEYAFYCIGDNIQYLTEDEKYILIMAGYLHDIGMCPTKEDKKWIIDKYSINDNAEYVDLIRNIHHELSFKFIVENWDKLKIPNKKYARAIGLVAMGHRKVNLFDFDIFELEYIVKGGMEFVCLPYLAGILRLADELDITNDRTPDLLFNKYYPENKISRAEWEKHRANYFVNFKNDRIIITAECTDLNVYYGLIDQKNKIESVLKDFHKLLRLLPTDRANLLIKYHQIEHNVEAKGFLPKKIGFSFDFQNTFNAFIGRNLYDSDFVAIREVIQNAIDSCLYKKSLNKTFNPEISISFIDNQLIVNDNGLGMDYFIIENYFAKLNSSYYQQSKISKNYESISQFGVGVFSYFLLCDYFDVETKSNNNEAIKFRVTKNADNSFYFFDDASREYDGTTIKLHLNEILDFNDIIKQVEFYFTYIEIPLVLSDKNGNHYEINKKKYKIEKTRLIAENVNLLAKDRIPEIDVIECEQYADIFEGIVNLFVVRKDNQIKPESLFKVIDKYTYSNYKIYQKGIFVRDFRSLFLNYTVGTINLKKKQILNISRNGFKNHKFLDEVISTFEKDIINQVFISWEKETTETKHKLSTDFVDEYIKIDQYDEGLVTLLKQYWIVKIYKDDVIQYIKFEELFSIESFILLNEFSAFSRFGRRDVNEREISLLFKLFNVPIVIVFNSEVTEKIIKLSELLSFSIQMVASSENHFIKINTVKKGILQRNSLVRKNSIPFEGDNSIIAYPNISVSKYFNSNHPIIAHIIQKASIINKNSAQENLYEELLSRIDDFIFNYHLHPSIGGLDEVIKKSNSILKHINSLANENFKLKKTDFPKWVLNYEKRMRETEKKRKLTRNKKHRTDSTKSE